MTKRQAKIDTQNPFIPSRSTICRWADLALVFGVAAAGLVAAMAAMLRQLGAM